MFGVGSVGVGVGHSERVEYCPPVHGISNGTVCQHGRITSLVTCLERTGCPLVRMMMDDDGGVV